MGLDPQLLGKDEVVVLHLRTHVKALVVPALLLVLIAVLSGFAFALLPTSWQPAASWIVLLLVLAALVLWVVVPFVRWLTSTYTFTNRRIITRRGIVVKSGHTCRWHGSTTSPTAAVRSIRSLVAAPSC